MIRKIILAVTFGAIFVLTFAIGVGFIIAGAGDFSWDIVSQYVSVSDVAKINDTPISNLFTFSDHSDYVGSHAEGQIGCPTAKGTLIFENITEEVTVISSSDEYIHLTVDGKIKLSSTTKNPKNLTGQNIPDIQFECNDSTDEAIIKVRKLRGKEIKMEIAIPESYAGSLTLKKVTGKLSAKLSLSLASLTVKDSTGTIAMNGVSAKKTEIATVAGEVKLTAGIFNQLKLTNSMNNVTVSGTVGSFRIKDVLGNVKISSDANLTKDSSITSVKGSIDVRLPKGSKFMLTKNNIKGIVTPLSGDKKADYTIAIDDVIGKVSISRSDD